MYISNQKLYFEMQDILQQWESGHYQDTLFNHGINKQNIKYVSAAELNITKSIVKVESIKPSPHYNNHTLISAINIYQEKLKNLLHDTLEQASDVFVVWLCYQGQWKYVISDDRIPCTQNNQLATLQCGLQWPILIEKAIAKLIGEGYQILNNQLSNYSIESYLHLLMGAPIDLVNYKTFDEFVKQLESNQIHYIQKKQGNKMLYCSFESQSVLKLQQLVTLKAVNEDSIFQEGQNIKGTYFDLTWQQIQEAINNKEVFVIRLKQNYYVNTIELNNPYQINHKFPNNSYIYKYTVNQTSEHIFTVCQYDQIFNKKQKEQLKYAMIRFMIFKIVDHKYQLIDGIYINKKHVTLSQCLQKGDYILYIEGQFYNIVGKLDASEHQTDLKLQIQSEFKQNIDDKSIFIQKLEQQDFNLSKQLIYSIALQQAKQNNTTILTKDKRAQRTHGEVFGLHYLVCQNFSTIEIEEEIDCSQCENLMDFQSQVYLTSFQMAISPNQYKMQVFTFDPLLMEKLDQPFIKFHFQIQQNKGDGIVTNQIITGTQPQTLQNVLKKEKQNKITNDMSFYVKQHDLGVAILFENNSSNSSAVNIKFQAQNLSFQLTDDQNVKLEPDNSMNLTLDGNKSSYILFNVIDVNMTHNFSLDVLSQINN